MSPKTHSPQAPGDVRDVGVGARERVWIALSDLWLDTEIGHQHQRQIAQVVIDSGLTEREANTIFELELAPFLSPNNRTAAGEWQGFDPEWVCKEARKRHERRLQGSSVRQLLALALARLGLTSYAARGPWREVKAIAFTATDKSAPDPLAEADEASQTVTVPITDTLDLHSFQPREIKEVAVEFVNAAHAEGLRELRLIHGRGVGAQRRGVRSALSQHELVAAIEDAPGNWGATVVRLR